jgi:hypothetical protein
MVQHALDRGYEVVGVCREQSVAKLDAFKGRITVIPGATDDREVIKSAVAGCDGVLTVLVPWGVHHYSSGTAQAVLDHARPGARLVFSCGWHITRDGQDVYSRIFKGVVKAVGWLARLARLVDLDDQVEACRRVFASDARWTVVRGSDLEEGESQGLPVWSRHVGDPILKSNITRRVDFALFMVEALKNDELVHEAAAIVGCQTPSALAHAAGEPKNDDAEPTLCDQLELQYRCVATPPDRRRPYPEALERAIRECDLVQAFIVDRRRLRRANLEFAESKLLLADVVLNLITWQDLFRLLNKPGAPAARWSTDLLKYLQLVGLDTFEGIGRPIAAPAALGSISHWRAKSARLGFEHAVADLLRGAPVTALRLWRAGTPARS